MSIRLFCSINGKQYEVAQGATFSEEYNETLDSGSILIPNIKKIKDLKPYDDVFIYEESAHVSRKSIFNDSVNGYIKTEFKDNKFTSKMYITKDFFDTIRNAESFDVKKFKIKYVTDIIGDTSSIDQSSIAFYDEANFDIKVLENGNVCIYTNDIPDEVIKAGFIFEDYTTGKDEKYIFSTLISDKGFAPNSRIIRDFTVEYTYEDSVPFDASKGFYKHMLIDTYNEELVRLESPKLYTYRINLFSETKGLETVQLPSVSITEPLFYDDKRSIYQYLTQFVELYSPRVKVVQAFNKWKYLPKYRLAEERDCIAENYEKPIKEIFDDCYSPDFTLTTPTFRQLLEKLFITKDMIPYVRDGVIYALDITQRRNAFTEEDLKHINYVSGNNSSGNYADNLRTNYSNGLGQEHSCKRLENLTFRNKDNALLTLSNLKLETAFPIYKVNNLVMCYYKKFYCKGIHKATGEEANIVVPILIEQDITPFIKLETERGVLSQDWDGLNKLIGETVEVDTAPGDSQKRFEASNFAKYKMCTLGYSIGSSAITGWGEKYNYPRRLFKNGNKTSTISFGQVEMSYLGNLCLILNSFRPYGKYSQSEVLTMLNEKYPNYSHVSIDPDNEILLPESIKSTIASANLDMQDYELWKFLGTLSTPYTSVTENLKAMFFKMDYDAFFNGAIVHSKYFGRDEITMNDNPSSALALMEKDGLFQKEKLNRIGNKTLKINARYENVSQLKNLGDVYNNEDDTDIIIYHREYSIFDKLITCSYFGSRDYVLKNYFTSVYAKQRTWSLMPYGESVNRAENKKVSIVLSKNHSYYEDGSDISYKGYSTPSQLFRNLFSFCNVSKIDKNPSEIDSDNKINFGYIEYNGEMFGADVNTFVTGNSLCFNIRMIDNISMGVQIEKYTSFDTFLTNGKISDTIVRIGGKNYDLTSTIEQLKEATVTAVFKFLGNYDYFKGSSQKICFIGDSSTGLADRLKFGIARITDFVKTTSEEDVIPQKIGEEDDAITIYYKRNSEISDLYSTIQKFPLIDTDKFNISNMIEYEKNIYKDNKDCIDMTFQFETVTDFEDKQLINGKVIDDIVFSPLMLKMSDLACQKIKLDNTRIEREKISFNEDDKEEIGTYSYNMIWDSKGCYKNYDPTRPTLVDYGIDSKQIVLDSLLYKTYDSSLLGYDEYIPSPAGFMVRIKLKKSAFDSLTSSRKLDINLDFSDACIAPKDLPSEDLAPYRGWGVLNAATTNIICSELNRTIVGMNIALTELISKTEVGDFRTLTLGGNVNVKFRERNSWNNWFGNEYKEATGRISMAFVMESTDTIDGEDYYIFTTKTVGDDGYESPRVSKITAKVDGINYDFPGRVFYCKRPNIEPYVNLTKKEYPELPLRQRMGSEDYDDVLEVEGVKEQDISAFKRETVSEDYTNMFVVYGEENVDNDYIYKEYGNLDRLNVVSDSTNLVNTFFSVVDPGLVQENGVSIKETELPSYIKISLKNFDLRRFKSIQFWYKDNIEYKDFMLSSDDSHASYKFIFGCNVKEDDLIIESRDATDPYIINGYIKVYISVVENKDKRVFNKIHQLSGEIEDYKNNEEAYGSGQFYKRLNIE